MADNNTTPRTVKFAAILFPDERDNTKWFASVICNEGPTYLNTSRAYADAYETANTNLEELFEYIPGNNAEVWLIHTTHHAAHELQMMELGDMFAAIEQLPIVPLTGVQRLVIDL